MENCAKKKGRGGGGKLVLDKGSPKKGRGGKASKRTMGVFQKGGKKSTQKNI